MTIYTAIRSGALSELMPVLLKHPDVRETNVGSQVGSTECAEHAPEAVPRDGAEARAPYPVAPATTVLLVAAEDARAEVDPPFDVVAVGDPDDL